MEFSYQSCERVELRIDQYNLCFPQSTGPWWPWVQMQLSNWSTRCKVCRRLVSLLSSRLIPSSWLHPKPPWVWRNVYYPGFRWSLLWMSYRDLPGQLPAGVCYYFDHPKWYRIPGQKSHDKKPPYQMPCGDMDPLILISFSHISMWGEQF